MGDGGPRRVCHICDVPLASIAAYGHALACPRCASPITLDEHAARCTSSVCEYADEGFPVVGGAPALIDFRESIVSRDAFCTNGRGGTTTPETHALDVRRRAMSLYARIYEAIYPPNRTASANMRRMLELLGHLEHKPVVLVVGGGTVGAGLDLLYGASDVDIVALDVYPSRFVNLLADGHRIPLTDSCVDAVVIQAVLEHVLSPSRVVDEIHRVLRPDGLVYADSPFLVPVHAGPLDFTRFTERGHRYLFRRFACIDSGVVNGAGTQLWWAIDFFVRALLRSPTAGAVARLAFAWLPRFDRFLDARHNVDAANAVFFLGRRSDKVVDDAEVIANYQGAQPVAWLSPATAMRARNGHHGTFGGQREATAVTPKSA
jgi:SAM-dependent methyltransferase